MTTPVCIARPTTDSRPTQTGADRRAESCGEARGVRVIDAARDRREDAGPSRNRGDVGLRDRLQALKRNAGHVEIGDGALHECRGGVGENGTAREGREGLVGDRAVHARAAAGGEENGGGAAHLGKR